jgi:hypothetical protein
MAMTEMATVTVVRNAAIMVAVVATVVSNGLSLLPSRPLRLLGALWLLALCLLGALRLLLVLCLLCALRLLLVLCLLCALRLLLVLRLLCALRLLLVLCLLCALWLLLVLCLLCFSSASALLLLSFLCECRSGGSEKQKQNRCADNSILVHGCCLQLLSHLPLTGYLRHTCYTVCAHGCQFSTAHVLGQKCSSQLMGVLVSFARHGRCKP